MCVCEREKKKESVCEVYMQPIFLASESLGKANV